jgi:hypothetical protein
VTTQKLFEKLIYINHEARFKLDLLPFFKWNIAGALIFLPEVCSRIGICVRGLQGWFVKAHNHIDVG